ncbi:hypothetical protein K7432_006625 [Basidiobolus ranarum]|uniref:SCP domain-containing protein n=1 Tax=Basidiobolus ranarum TaxID=34480 RepID=A0ABR2W1B4_9FUNG
MKYSFQTFLYGLLFVLTIFQAVVVSGEPSSQQIGDVNLMLEAVNQERQKVGAPSLKLDSRLVAAAQAHSDYQARTKTLTHDEGSADPAERIRKAGVKYSAYGENVASGYSTIQQVMKGWMNSDGHRKNILNARFTHMGSGFNNNGDYWTQDFALVDNPESTGTMTSNPPPTSTVDTISSVDPPTSRGVSTITLTVTTTVTAKVSTIITASPSLTSPEIPTTTSSPAPSNNPSDPDAMLAAVNAERERAKIPLLKLDKRLSEAAQQYADILAQSRSLSSNAGDNSLVKRTEALGLNWVETGENIAKGYDNISSVMQAFLNSPDRRKIILNAKFIIFGSGFNSNGNYWTQEFLALSNTTTC